MTEFTPGPALAGGVLIGLAASGLLLLQGRIAGISGILGSVLREGDDRNWRMAFLVGLPIGAALTQLVAGPAPVVVTGSTALLIGAGVFVGVGTQVGTGCTSGHGVCGIARFSARSIVATLTFIGVAGLVVFLRGVGSA